ncbi:MAG: hypothetical protein ACRDIF_03635 [Actinomycetota bacterium]
MTTSSERPIVATSDATSAKVAEHVQRHVTFAGVDHLVHQPNRDRRQLISQLDQQPTQLPLDVLMLDRVELAHGLIGRLVGSLTA